MATIKELADQFGGEKNIPNNILRENGFERCGWGIRIDENAGLRKKLKTFKDQSSLEDSEEENEELKRKDLVHDLGVHVKNQLSSSSNGSLSDIISPMVVDYFEELMSIPSDSEGTLRSIMHDIVNSATDFIMSKEDFPFRYLEIMIDTKDFDISDVYKKDSVKAFIEYLERTDIEGNDMFSHKLQNVFQAVYYRVLEVMQQNVRNDPRFYPLRNSVYIGPNEFISIEQLDVYHEFDDSDFSINCPEFRDHILHNLNRLLPNTWIGKLAKSNKRIARVLENKKAVEYFDLVNMNSEQRKAVLDEKNREVVEKLESIGINLDEYLKGISPTYFDLSGRTSTREEVVAGVRDELYRASEDLMPVLKSQQGFIEKLYSATGILRIGQPSQSEDLKYILSMIDGNEDLTRKYVTTALDYASKSANVNNREGASIPLIHLRKINSILKFEELEEGSETFSVSHMKGNMNLVRDVSIGYESGCCLLEEQIIPHLLDYATQFSQLHKGRQRRGMGLLFAAYTGRTPVLVVNSIEMNHTMSKYSPEDLKKITDNMLDYVSRYAQQSGFRHVLVGAHGYNTAFNYASELKRKKPYGKNVWKIGPGLFGDVIQGSYNKEGPGRRIENCVLL